MKRCLLAVSAPANGRRMVSEGITREYSDLARTTRDHHELLGASMEYQAPLGSNREQQEAVGNTRDGLLGTSAMVCRADAVCVFL